MSIQIPDPCMNTECAWFGLRHLDNCVPLVPPTAPSVPSDFEDRVEWPPAPTPETPRNGLNSPTPKQIRKGYADAMKQIEPFIGKAAQPSTPATGDEKAYRQILKRERVEYEQEIADQKAQITTLEARLMEARGLLVACNAGYKVLLSMGGNDPHVAELSESVSRFLAKSRR